MKLAEILFGKKKTVRDDLFGIIESNRIKSQNLNKSYTWSTEYKLPNSKMYTTIIFEGNYKEPNFTQLSGIKNIIKNIDEFYQKIDIRLKSNLKNIPLNNRYVFENWKSEFYLDAIIPLDDNKMEFEFCFSKINNENGYMQISYRNGKLEDFDIKS